MEEKTATKINKLIPKIKYKQCLGFKEAEYTNTLGKRTVALILPSVCIYRLSPSYISVDRVTGDLLGERAPELLRMSTLLEMVSAAWRHCAHLNMSEISRLHTGKNKFNEMLDKWLDAHSSTGIDCFRIFAGGNPCCGSILRSCVEVASNHPSKNVFMPLEGSAAHSASLLLRKNNPENVFVFEEVLPGRKGNTSLPKMYYEQDAKGDDVTIFPDNREDSRVRVTRFENSELPWWFCLERKMHLFRKSKCIRAGNYNIY